MSARRNRIALIIERVPNLVGAAGRLAKNIVRLEHVGRFVPMLVALLTLSSCIADPDVPPVDSVTGVGAGVLVVNEGLWRQGNASLTLYDAETETATTGWFRQMHPTRSLGDMGNDVVVRGRTAYVLLSGSASIEVIDLGSGLELGRVALPEGTFPTSLLIADDSTGWVSNLEDDSVIEFNPTTFGVGRRIPVGPAPEGLAFGAGRLFVCNSGLGALRADESGAGTISVIDPVSGTEERRIDVGGNLRHLHYSPESGNLYAFVGAALPDTTGSGLVEIDPVAFRTQRRWRVSGAWEAGFDETAQVAYLLAQSGIVTIGLAGTSGAPEPFVDRSFNTLDEEVPHSLAVSPFDGQIYVGVVRGYFSAPGRVDRYDREGSLVGSFDAGLNPTAFAFFR